MKKSAGLVRSHLGPAIAAAVTTVVLVGGVLTLTLVGTESTPQGAAAAPAGGATTTTVAPPGAAGHQGKAAKRAKGQITAINGTTWTVSSAKGVPLAVEVTMATVFGTKSAPLTASSFKVGDHIVVTGTRSKSTVTATAIGQAPASAP